MQFFVKALFLLISLLITFLGFFMSGDGLKFYIKNQHTIGVVIGDTVINAGMSSNVGITGFRHSSSNITMHHAIVKYQTLEEDSSVTFIEQQGGNSHSGFEIGEKIKVIYNPNKLNAPRGSRAYSFLTFWEGGLWFFIIGALLFGFAIFMAIKK